MVTKLEEWDQFLRQFKYYINQSLPKDIDEGQGQAYHNNAS